MLHSLSGGFSTFCYSIIYAFFSFPKTEKNVSIYSRVFKFNIMKTRGQNESQSNTNKNIRRYLLLCMKKSLNSVDENMMKKLNDKLWSFTFYLLHV